MKVQRFRRSGKPEREAPAQGFRLSAFSGPERGHIRRMRRDAQKADPLAMRKPGQFHYRACLRLMGAGKANDRIRAVVWSFENT